jgi:hypothetical protein
VDTGSSDLALCLFGRDIPEGGMKPLTIVVYFDIGEQVVPGSIPGWVASVSIHFGRVFFNLGAICGKRENRTS